MKWFDRLFVGKRRLWEACERWEKLVTEITDGKRDAKQTQYLKALADVQRQWDICIRDRARIIAEVRRSMKLDGNRMRARLRALVEDYD